MDARRIESSALLLLDSEDLDAARWVIARARAAGVPSVLVTFGPSGHDIEALKPEALLHHYDQLFDLVERLIV